MHRVAGATEVAISSARRFAILHELRDQPEWDLPALLGKLSPVDLVLVEGFKRDAFPKLEIHRTENGKPLLHPETRISSRSRPTSLCHVLPVIELDDIEASSIYCSSMPCRRRHAEPVMAQLTDDCFAFSGPLMPIAEMETLIAARVSPVVETEQVGLHPARGRVLARAVTAPLDLPPFDNSAVDGYAVRHRDLAPEGETRLAVSGRLTAGAAASTPIAAGDAIRIFTGAPMPAGADTVFMQEDVTVEGNNVIVPKGLKLGANRRLAGEDVPAGNVVLPEPKGPVMIRI